MVTHDSTSTGTASQLTPDEMRRLAQRLRARAGSVLMKDQPHQAADLCTAASIIEQFASISAEILATAAAVDRLSKLLGIGGGA